MAKNYLGIDLGTTETVVAVVEIDLNQDSPADKLRTLNIYQYNLSFEFDRDNKKLQSSIYIDRDNNKVYTGDFAKKLYSEGNRPLNTIRSVKTRIGGQSMIQVPKESNKSDIATFGMTELSAFLLKTVHESYKKQCDGELVGVTITIPAAFNSDERKATLDAAYLAGFDRVHLLDEPTAVLLAFLNSTANPGTDFFQQKKQILVYDIGGGTLDISVAAVENCDGELTVDILGRSKRMDFGGDDIDKYIAAYFLQEFERINPSIQSRTREEQAVIISRIVTNAERAKVQFSTEIAKYLDNERRRRRVKEYVNFEIIDSLKITDLLLTDELLREILAPVISSEGMLLAPLNRTIKDCRLAKEDIDLVILTGGTGKFYLVQEAINLFFQGRVEIIDFTAGDAVAKGAAINSFNMTEDYFKKINIKDILSDSVFIKSGELFDKLIPHDTPIKTRGTYIIKLKRPTNRLDVFLYYGSENEEIYKYREIAGAYKTLDRFYDTGEELILAWELDANKAIRLFLNGSEIFNTRNSVEHLSHIVNSFSLNP